LIEQIETGMGHAASTDRKVDEAIAGLMRGQGRDYIGEPVSQIEHALQCAALARAARASDHEVLAALFHDIGHLIAGDGAAEMDGLGIVDHEAIGAVWLRGLGFDQRVCELVGAHVQAKRYLAKRKAGYHERLSEASRGTLAFQGGVMSESEAARFESDPLFAAKVRLRAWDEAAKESDRQVPSLESYTALIREHLEQYR
jgi:phosphonate degradation associated HDIG domain protein